MSSEDTVESLLFNFFASQQTEVDSDVVAYLAAGLTENDEVDSEEMG
jgi:hypothetical protein